MQNSQCHILRNTDLLKITATPKRMKSLATKPIPLRSMSYVNDWA